MPASHPSDGPEGLFQSFEAFYQALVEQVPAVVYIDSDEQRPDSLYISPQSERILGYPPSAYLARPELWRDNTHPDDRSLVATTWAAARASGQSFQCEYRVQHRNGRWLWIRDGAEPVRGPDGKVRAWQGVLHDVTAQKEAEHAIRGAEEKYRALVENVPAVVYLVAPDDDRRTLYVSPQVERALGYPREEWLDQPDIWMELLHPDDREQTLAAHDTANETGQPWSREYRLIAADGHVV
ncbi:MAG TPA: PAS domain-containing protein, partial [Actinomycetota bacterium]|nr:PAS domain-containing protein [Actinomycetota bacterium]